MTKTNPIVCMVICAAITACSLDNDEMIFKADLKKVNDKTTLTYFPKTKFEEVSDSLYQLLDPRDYNKIYGGPIKFSQIILNEEKFIMRVMLIENYALIDQPKYQIILRTFSKDMKMIDRFIVAKTTGASACDGYITKDLKVYKSCEDGTETVAAVNKYGEFIIQE